MRRLKIIRACLVLHNVCDENYLSYFEEPIEESIEPLHPGVANDSGSEDEDDEEFHEDGSQVRDNLCDTFDME